MASADKGLGENSLVKIQRPGTQYAIYVTPEEAAVMGIRPSEPTPASSIMKAFGVHRRKTPLKDALGRRQAKQDSEDVGAFGKGDGRRRGIALNPYELREGNGNF